MEIQTNPIKKSKWWSKLLTTLGVLFVIFCVLLVYGTKINNRFYKLLVVTSNSMTPVFQAGDLICIVRANPSEVKVGDIVTFKAEEGILTHRIVEIKPDGEIITKGDANNTNDSWSNGWKLGKVETKYLFKIPKLGYFISWWSGLFEETDASLKDKVTSKGNKIIANVPTPTIEAAALPSELAFSTPTIEPTATPIEETPTIEPTTSPEETASIEPTATPEETPIQNGSQ